MKNLIDPPQVPRVMPQNQSQPSAGTSKTKGFDVTDLKQYFHIVVKRIWLVALCFVIALSVTVVLLMRQVPAYQARSVLLFSGGLPVPDQLLPTEMKDFRGSDYIATQQRIIQSRMVLAGARERMNWPAEEISKQLLRISVSMEGKTSFMGIMIKALDPVFAADFANALAEEYLDFKAEERMDTSQQTVISLTQQANRLREELKRAEEAQMQFERENSIVALKEKGNVAASTLGNLAKQVAEYRTKRMLLEAQQPLLSEASDEIVLQTLASPSMSLARMNRSAIGSIQDKDANTVSLASGPEALIERGLVQQPRWEELNREKARLESELTELRSRLRDEHPLIQEKKKRMAEIDRELNVELQFALKQFYSKLDSLKIQEQASRRVQLEWQDQAIETTRKEHEYKNLQRGVSRLQGLYDLVFNRLKEIDVSIGIEPETIRIVERAVPPTSPVAPRKLQSVFVAALAGIGIGLGLVFGLEYLDDSIRYPEEVTEGLHLPFYGVIPSANWDQRDLRSHILSNMDQKSGLTEAYRNVRSALIFNAPEETHRVVAITSAVPKEGKTTTSLNLSVSLAQAGSRILLVDSDLRRGELHKFFGLEAGRGFSDLLVGQAKPESVIQRTGIPNLDLIATGPFPPNPAEIIMRPELQSFLDFARRTYDRVIFDCPPVMAVSEAGILASLLDGTIFVVWAGQTSKKLSSMAVDLLRERGGQVIGCVLNNLEFGRVGYYYYSTYYGYYDYEYRYDRSTR